jgi:hypothetical protein
MIAACSATVSMCGGWIVEFVTGAGPVQVLNASTDGNAVSLSSETAFLLLIEALLNCPVLLPGFP